VPSCGRVNSSGLTGAPLEAGGAQGVEEEALVGAPERTLQPDIEPQTPPLRVDGQQWAGPAAPKARGRFRAGLRNGPLRRSGCTREEQSILLREVHLLCGSSASFSGYTLNGDVPSATGGHLSSLQPVHPLKLMG
ncbi:hypothetical protein INR49_014492, partial [Caranx melampygus]